MTIYYDEQEGSSYIYDDKEHYIAPEIDLKDFDNYEELEEHTESKAAEGVTVAGVWNLTDHVQVQVSYQKFPLQMGKGRIVIEFCNVDSVHALQAGGVME